MGEKERKKERKTETQKKKLRECWKERMRKTGTVEKKSAYENSNYRASTNLSITFFSFDWNFLRRIFCFEKALNPLNASNAA